MAQDRDQAISGARATITSDKHETAPKRSEGFGARVCPQSGHLGLSGLIERPASKRARVILAATGFVNACNGPLAREDPSGADMDGAGAKHMLFYLARNLGHGHDTGSRDRCVKVSGDTAEEHGA